MRLLSLLFAFLFPVAALAQGGAVSQSGPVTPGHIPVWATNRVVQDGGAASNGIITNIGLLGTGLPLCINDAPITSPTGYHQLCFGANSAGGGLISYNPFGPATGLPLHFNVNGVTYTVPFGGGGTPGGSNGQVQYNNAGAFGGLTNAQLTADINVFSSSLSGAAPSSGGGTMNFLRADGTWSVPPGGAPGGSTGQVQINNAGVFGGITNTVLTSDINVFTSSLSGAAPASGGGTSNFLRADGSWAAPAGGGNVNGPGSSTNGNAVIWNGTSGTSIANGPPIGQTGNSTIVETSSGGLIAASILPLPTASTLGGVESFAQVTHQFLVQLSTAGVFTAAQPAFTDISGQTTLAQLPTLSANQVLGALTATTPSGLSLPSCSGVTSALQYTSGTGFGCATVGGSGGTAQVQDFLAGTNFTPGTTTSVTLSSTPISAAALQITFDGVKQSANTWSLATATVTFNAAIPLSTQVVEAQWVIVAGSTVPGGSTTNIQYNSSGSFAGNNGLTYDGTSVVTLGVAGTSVGGLKFSNASSGFIEFQPTTGALGSAVLTMPDVTDTLAVISSAQTLTNKTMSGASNTFSAIPIASLAAVSANTIIANATGSITSPAPVAIPSCSTASSALTWTTSSGFGCNTISSSGTPGGATSNVQYNSSGTFAGNGGFTYDGTSQIGLGVAGTSVGSVAFRNATSGSIVLAPTTGILGSVTLTLPDTTGIVLCDVCVQTVTNKSISGSEINSGIVAANVGGTGVNNGSSTITLGGSLTTSGAFASTFTMTGPTSVTFPTAGTLLTTNGNGSGLTGLTYTQLPTLGANQVLGALTATTPSGLSVPSCSSPGNALIWTPGAGFGCNANVVGLPFVVATANGVKCDGVTNDLAAINGLLAVAQTVIMPYGTCIINGTMTMNVSGTRFIGQGGNDGTTSGSGTVIKTTSATADMLQIGNSAVTNGVLVQGMTFTSSVTRTGSAAGIHRYGGAWIVINDVHVQAMVHDVILDGTCNGATGPCDYDNFITNSSFQAGSLSGINIGFGNNTTTTFLQNEFFFNNDVSGNGGTNSNNGGVVLFNCGGCGFWNTQGIFNSNGIIIEPQSGQWANVTFEDGGFDTSYNAGLYFHGKTGGRLTLECSNCAFTATGGGSPSNTAGVGIFYDTPAAIIDNIHFNGGLIYFNAFHGYFENQASQNVQFTGVKNYNNATLTTSGSANYDIATGTVHMIIAGGQAGHLPGNGGTPAFGFLSSGTTDYISISGVDFSGTGSSGTCTFSSGTLTGGISCGTIGSHSVQAAVMP